MPQGGRAGEDTAGDQEEEDGETQTQQGEGVQSHSRYQQDNCHE